MSLEQRRWYRLDNTGNLYPSVLTPRNTTLFRIALQLKEPVNIDRLTRAVEPVMQRFPYYRVQLRPGAFWYSFEENPRLPSPVIDSLTPCTHMPIKKRGVFPFRIRVFERTLAVEFSHALTDGTGALLFLASLLASYRLTDPKLSEERVEKMRRELGADPYILLFDERGEFTRPSDEEFQDAFRLYYDKRVPPPDQEKKVFHLRGKFLPVHGYRVLTGEVPIEKVLEKSRRLGVSLTEYLVAVYFYALQEIQRKYGARKNRRRSAVHPLSVMVPVNLRNILPSATMRNFFLTLNPLLDTRLGHYELEEIAQRVHHFIQIQLDRRHLSQQLTRNVKGTVRPFIRIAPLFLKNMTLKSIHRGYGESRYSGSLSNLGRVKFPPCLQELVEGITLVPPPSTVIKKKCGVISYGDTLVITFGSLIEETALERLFFTYLRREGIPVRMRGNWKGGGL